MFRRAIFEPSGLADEELPGEGGESPHPEGEGLLVDVEAVGVVDGGDPLLLVARPQDEEEIRRLLAVVREVLGHHLGLEGHGVAGPEDPLESGEGEPGERRVVDGGRVAGVEETQGGRRAVGLSHALHRPRHPLLDLRPHARVVGAHRAVHEQSNPNARAVVRQPRRRGIS